MTKTVPAFPAGFRSFCLLTISCALLCASQESMAFTSPPRSKPFSYSIQLYKVQNSKKYKLRLYSQPDRQALLFSASGSGSEGKNYKLFVFDMDGRLVAEAHIKSSETTALNNISSGNYWFEVFLADEEVENGQLMVK
jgi:hypothetical protein